MKLVRKLFFFCLIIIIGVGSLYFASTKGWLNGTPLENISFDKIGFLNQENIEQTQVLTERAKETSTHVQQILGESIVVDEQATDEKKEKAIHEKTLEYVKYLYCKQVVEDWEATH